jgi:hypothetical protein
VPNLDESIEELPEIADRNDILTGVGELVVELDLAGLRAGMIHDEGRARVGWRDFAARARVGWRDFAADSPESISSSSVITDGLPATVVE